MDLTKLTDIFYRLWLKELEQSDAILASQIHVFNSFFYKKLNHHQKGYVYVYCCAAVKLISTLAAPIWVMKVCGNGRLSLIFFKKNTS
jgi:Ulp1 protease family, C-terminal catalytic domain